MKKYLALLLAVLMLAAVFTGCASKETTTDTPAASTDTAEPAKTDENTAAEETPAAEPASEEGKVFNIYAWNEEFKGFFEKYYTVPEGVTVNWIITPSADGAYQDKLDEALLNQENASADDKVDLFLAEADYIQKYTESPVTQDVTALGVTDFSSTYAYTVQAASDASGVVKGVSFQCCPAALIYRRSIAKDVLGTDDPAEVQELLNSWDKFNAVAADAKAKGYLMTASEAATYRVFSNNVSEPWVDANNNLQIDPAIQTWMQQAKDFSDNGYTQDCDIWSDECTAPAWYFNFSMGNAQDADKGCFGDWAICEGPQAHFWGGTWLLAPAGTDNPTMVADIMNTFINNEEVCTNLVKNEAQFSNNQKVNETVATRPTAASSSAARTTSPCSVTLPRTSSLKTTPSMTSCSTRACRPTGESTARAPSPRTRP